MRKYIALTVCIGVLALAALLGAMSGGGGVVAAPAYAPTPVSVTQPVRVDPALYTLLPTTVMTQATRGTCRELGFYSVVDLQVVIDMSNTNTTTGYLQFTNDLVTYINGTNVISVNADATEMVQAPLFGRYACWYSTVATTTAPITVTVSAWAK